jgi:hypothetical protein
MMRPLEQFYAVQVEFLGEQDGPPERELKARLVQLPGFEVNVSRAYLARVLYGDSHSSVALCVYADSTDNRQTLAAMVGQIFSSMFGSQAQLDIIFLNEEQHAKVAECCRPFFFSSNPTYTD